jgi:hypothetical protein
MLLLKFSTIINVVISSSSWFQMKNLITLCRLLFVFATLLLILRQLYLTFNAGLVDARWWRISFLIYPAVGSGCKNISYWTKDMRKNEEKRVELAPFFYLSHIILLCLLVVCLSCVHIYFNKVVEKLMQISRNFLHFASSLSAGISL